MSQNTMVINDTLSGTTYASNHNGQNTNYLSSHSGASRPSYAAAGTVWLKNSATPWELYMYDGTDDILLGYVNATTNVFSPANALFQNWSTNYIQTAGSSNAYTAAFSPARTTYTTGEVVAIKANFSNTGSATISFNGLSAKTIKDNSGATLGTNAILSGGIYLLAYDGTDMLIQNPSGSSLSAASQADMEAASSTSVYVSPGRQHFHPLHPKAAFSCDNNGSFTTLISSGISSLTDTNVGRITANFTTAFSSANYIVSGSSYNVTGSDVSTRLVGRTTTTAPTTTACEISCVNLSGGALGDIDYADVVFLGDL